MLEEFTGPKGKLFPVSAYARSSKNLKDLKDLQFFLRKGVLLGYVGRNYNLKNLKARSFRFF